MLNSSKELRTTGISLVTSLNSLSGLAQVGRDFLAKLALTDVQHEVLDETNRTYLDKICDKFHIQRLFKKNPKYKKVIHFETYPKKLDKKYYNFKTIFWEFESGMLEYRPKSFEGVDEVIAFTDFLYEYLRKIAPKNVKITKVKYPFFKNWQISKSKEQIRNLYKINQNDFVCYFNFDYRSCYDRKNPEAVLNTFKESIANNQDAKLVIKTNGYDKRPQDAQRLNGIIKKMALEDKVIVINKKLSRDELMSTINACDCYISLHRGEGLGLGMLEAMALAKPVIATNYSGNTEFTRPDNSLLVDYELVAAKTDFKAYLLVDKWAEPNIETAKTHLLLLYKDRMFAQELGSKAKQFVDEYFNLDDFKLDLEKIIKN